MNIMSRKNSATQPAASPYGSAMDLPSVQEQLKLLQGGKLVTRVIACDQRQKLVELVAELHHLMGTVDRFYDLLGARHWVYTDCFSVEAFRRFENRAWFKLVRRLIAFTGPNAAGTHPGSEEVSEDDEVRAERQTAQIQDLPA